jgi:serine/threonine protein kinase
MPYRIGQQLGNYRLMRLLGVGGFAEVYLGQHVHLETPAAIKVLRTSIDSGDVTPTHMSVDTYCKYPLR